MKKSWLTFLLMPAFAGCLTTESPELAEWSIATKVPPAVKTVAALKERSAADFGMARLSQLIVRSPYDIRSMQVLRADGTLVPDSYNHFAAAPSQLLKGPIQDALGSSSRFTTVVGSSSAATIAHTVEVTVTKLLLDCSTAGSRLAEVELMIVVMNRDRQIVWTGAGAGREAADDGNFGRAFSEALGMAIRAALGS